MSKSVVRLFQLYGDKVSVSFRYSEEHGMYFGDYPDFCETPRHTPCGRPWVNVLSEGCEYTQQIYGDCGSCQYLRTEKPGDLIGVCDHHKKRIHQRE